MMQDSQTNEAGNNIAADKTGEVDLNPKIALEQIDSWLDGFVKLLPNIAVALVLFILFWIAARVTQTILQKGFKSRGRGNLGEVLGGFAKWAILLFGGVIALTIIIPSLEPANIVAGLGVSSVAIGFAFKDILQNWLAGLLILLRQPFEIGDQIEASGFEGTVEHIETRATIIKTYDGQRAVIPNSEIYTNAVLVKTGETVRRTHYDVGIGYADDIDGTCEILSKIMTDHPEVMTDPAPQTLIWGLDASWVTIRMRWWTDSRKSDVVGVKSDILREVKYALDDAGVDMPFETQVHLFHDQTEDVDGDREGQREGWPAPKEGAKPKPRYKVSGSKGSPKSSEERA